jgi:DNA N-6-adenine-methyltransferase (Dam)
MKNKSNTISDVWLTPKDFYQKLDKRFTFDLFDPCPPDNDIKKFDGLSVPWANRTFVNPPYSRLLKEKFIYKAYSESLLGKLVVMLLPVSTSTKIFHELILPNAKIEYIRGRLAFEGIDRDGNWVNAGMGMYELQGVPEGAERIKRAGQNDNFLIIFGKE